MYACGLVLWELASRCTASFTPTTSNMNYQNLNTHCTLSVNPGGGGGSNAVMSSLGNEYKLPFETEIANATLEQMKVNIIVMFGSFDRKL